MKTTATIRAHKMRPGAILSLNSNAVYSHSAGNLAARQLFSVDHVTTKSSSAINCHEWKVTRTDAGMTGQRQEATVRSVPDVPHIVGTVIIQTSGAFAIRRHPSRKDAFDVVSISYPTPTNSSTTPSFQRVGVIQLSRVSMWKHAFTMRFTEDCSDLLPLLVVLLIKNDLVRHHSSDNSAAVLAMSQTIAALPFVGAAAT